MPIEINEIAIQLKVRDEAGVADDDAPPDAGEGSGDAGREELVAECVSRVLRALKAQQER